MKRISTRLSECRACSTEVFHLKDEENAMLKIHHPPKAEITVSDFSVTLNGEKTLPWFCRVSAMPYNTVWPGHQRPMDQSEVASFLSFEMSEPVTVHLVASRDFDDLSIRPLSKGVQARVHGREIEFTLTQCGSYTVELDGWHNALHIFANPVCDFGVTDKSAPGVRYFGPGIHEVGDLELSNGETLFVDGGAVLYGSVTAIHKKNVRVVGYGVIDGSREVRDNTTSLITWGVGKDLDLRDEATLRAHLKEENVLHGCVHFYSCQDSEIAGVIARDSATFAFILADCERVNCERVKTIGMWRYNSDGVDLFNSRYVRIADCFLRNFDDCIVLKGIKGWDRENLHHIVVSGCTVWCDWGSALEVGAETCADEYYDIVWENCDVIHASLACMRTHNSDRAHVHDMVLRDIRCEYSRYDLLPVYQSDMRRSFDGQAVHSEPWLILSPVYDGPFSNDHILGSTSSVRYENITIYAPEDMPAPRCGFDGQNAVCEPGGSHPEHCNRNIVLENFVRDGRRLTRNDLFLQLGDFSDVTVK